VISAPQEVTQRKRLDTLITDSAAEKRLKQLVRSEGKRAIEARQH
jgi:hypothetical protein